MFLVFVEKSRDLCWDFCNFSDFQIGKTQNSQEFSRRDLDNSSLIVVYFKGYLSQSCTFVHFWEIFNFVQFSQHICHFAEVLSSFLKKNIDYPNLYTKRQLYLFMQKVCKHTLQVEIEVSNCCRIKHFNGYNRFETDIFSIFHAWNDFFSME